MIIMGVNLRDKFLVGDYSKKLLKGISFLGLFLFLVVNGYGQVTATIGISDLALSSGETATVTITFSGVAVGFDNTDLTLPGGTLTPVNSTDGNITFTAIYTPPVGVESATNVITLDNTGVTDTIGTAGTGTTDSPNFSIDTAAPSGYSVLINQDPINAGNETAVSFTFTGAEVGATYNYTFSSTGGGGPLSASGTVASAGQTISGINLSGLGDGTITLSVTLTDINGNQGLPATDTSSKDTAVPSGYSVVINQDPINAGNQTAVSFTFTGAEVGATYNYSFTSSGGGGTVGASGTVASTGQTISPINLSTLPDGTITLSVTLTNGNGTGSAATDTSTKDTAAPSGYSVVINQDPINAGNETAVSFTFTERK